MYQVYFQHQLTVSLSNSYIMPPLGAQYGKEASYNL